MACWLVNKDYSWEYMKQNPFQFVKKIKEDGIEDKLRQYGMALPVVKGATT